MTGAEPSSPATRGVGSGSWDDSRRAFTEAAAAFVGLTQQVGDRWTRPGLGEWDVRALVGHTSRALLTVEAYLQRPAEAVQVLTAAEYFCVARPIAAGPDVPARGVEAGDALGEDPAGAVGRIAGRVVPLLAARTGAEVIDTVVGGMRLCDYLPTRTLELTVHGADLAAALGTSYDVPPSAAAQTLAVLGEIAALDGRAGPLLLAATGRTGLPTGYSAL